MKKLGTVFITTLVVSLCMFIAIMLWMGARYRPKPPLSDVWSSSGKSNWEIFLNSGDLYCLNGFGELYIRENEHYTGSPKMTILKTCVGGNIYIRENPFDKFIHTFPTREVHWSDKYRTFLYYDEGAIFSYDQRKDITKELFKVKWEYEKFRRDWIFDSVDKYVFLNFDKKSYRIDLETSDVLPLTEFADYTVTKNSNMLLYKVHEENTIMCHELSTNKEYKLNNKDFYNDTDLSIDIKSACMVEDILYFTKSDGQIYGVQISNEGAKNIEVFPKNSDITKKKVVGIEWTGESFICVLLDFNKENGVKNLSVCELYPDGTYDIIRKDDEIYYGTLDIPCTIKIQGKKYAYLVRTDDLVVFGWTFDRFN